MADAVARSPIRPVEPAVVDGWEVTTRRTCAELTLADLTPLAKIGVRADFKGAVERALGVPFGRAARDRGGSLVVGCGPGEWLVLGPVGHERELLRGLQEVVAATGEDLVTILNLTHGRALVRLTGSQAAALLAKVCAIDLADTRTPNGAAFRSSVAKLVTDVVRDDEQSPAGPVRSYLLHCDRSYGQYLFDALLDAGAEFAIQIDGARSMAI